MSALRHFLDIWRLDTATLRAILTEASRRKILRAGWPTGRIDADAIGADRRLAMIFQRNSTRTWFSFDAAMRQLGGATIIATSEDMHLGRTETIEDTARVLSRMVDAVMIRAERHDQMERFALASSVPVINGLTNLSHPCQILADVMTFEEHRGPIAGRKIVWVGDGNNVCSSFIHASARFDFELVIACPAQYHPRLEDLARAERDGGRVTMTEDVCAAVAGAHCVVSDTWVSMGNLDHEARVAAFERYQVDDDLMDLAAADAIFLHCLPAHRGEEVTDRVIDGPKSLVWHEAENRIHAQKAVLAWCFGGVC